MASLANVVTYQRITLHMSTPWVRGQGGRQIWSCKFNLSGASALLANEMEPTALDLWDPIRQLCRPETYLAGWRYYPPEGHTATGLLDYTSLQHPAASVAFAASAPIQNTEVCYYARAYLNKSATGKPVYLRKYIHGAQSSADGQSIPTYSGGVTPATIFAKWNTGSGPKAVVPIDPTGGQQSSAWELLSQLHTHQLRRGPRRKAKTTTVYVPVPVP